MVRSFFFFTLFIFTGVVAQQTPDIQVRLDTNHIRIGEQFHYTIAAPKDSLVSFPDSENLGLKILQLVKEYPVDTLKDKLLKKYLLTGFDSGYHHIPNQEIFIGKKRRLYFTDSIPIKISTVEVDTVNKKPFGIKPIATEPIIIDDYIPYFYSILFVCLLIFLAVIGYFIFRRYRKKKTHTAQKPLLPPFEEAMHRFKNLDEKTQGVKNYYIELTEIIRVYMHRKMNLHTLEETTPEIMIDFEKEILRIKLPLEKEAVTSCEDILKRGDFVKFAKWQPPAHQIITDKQTAINFVTALNESFEVLKQLAKETESESLESKDKKTESE